MEGLISKIKKNLNNVVLHKKFLYLSYKWLPWIIYTYVGVFGPQGHDFD